MRLLKQIIEDAAGGAVGGGDVASCAMPLFSSLVKQKTTTSPVRTIKIGKRNTRNKNKSLREMFATLREDLDPEQGSGGSPDFDSTEVISKLKGLENKETTDNQNTVTFGLEDDEQGIIRVTVKQEQAEDFEHALQTFLTGSSDEHDQKKPEIAELLFKLKDNFDIINVEWPEIQEDEEEGQELAMNQDGEGVEGDVNVDVDADVTAGPDSNQVQDLLTQVIDMMKADAEARKADAEARSAEAKNREAEAGLAQSMARVKQEEQLLDMDTYNKAKKEEEREAKRLAQLAKWKHETKDTDDVGLSGLDNFGSEEEEQIFSQKWKKSSTPKSHKRVHAHDIANFMLKRVK